MPDITMCEDKECPNKDKCYRYLAESSDYQSYFTETPRVDNECEYYWEIISN
ncbi:MAG: hypothetical protein PHF05_06400 [Candidatus Izemoplasmatales bacterium]|nr:hypothetical protein [Candidatus Izemoplasmatales bacterium]